MIILSGVLVVVAIGLLIAGIVTGNSGTEVAGLDGLNLIYISIGVSIVSALFLAVGVFLRRKDLFGSPDANATGTAKRGKAGKAGRGGPADTAAKPATTPVGATTTATSGGTSVYPTGSHASGADPDTADLAAMMPPAGDVPATAVVHVVPGRRRYHIDSCRQLAGRDTQELTFEEAREEGFSPCTACMPDTALAARAVTGGLGTTDEPETEPESAAADEAASEDERGAVGQAEWSASNGSPSSVTPVQRQALDDLAEEEPARPGSGPAGDEAVPAASDDETNASDDDDEPDDSGDTATAAEVPPQATRPTPVATTTAGEQEEQEAAATGEGSLVRILSGTKRYHRPDCALIEDIGDDADDLESLSRAEAKARGCTPCLVCQPDKEPATRD